MGQAPNISEVAGRADDPARVLLIGERFLLLDALRVALAADDMDVAAIGTTAHGIEKALTGFHPDVVFFDASQSAIDANVQAIQALQETGRVVGAIAMEAVSVEAAQLVSAGAECVLGLDTGLEDLALAINRCLAGDTPMPLDRRYELEQLLREHRTAERHRLLLFEELTRRERDMFALVYEGLSADQIAEELCVSVSTVRSHIRNILNKLHVGSQLAAVAMARSNDWFAADSMSEVA